MQIRGNQSDFYLFDDWFWSRIVEVDSLLIVVLFLILSAKRGVIACVLANDWLVEAL